MRGITRVERDRYPHREARRGAAGRDGRDVDPHLFPDDLDDVADKMDELDELV